MLIKPFGCPHATRLDESIRHFDKLAHDCNDGDLGGLSGAPEFFVFDLEIQIASHSISAGM